MKNIDEIQAIRKVLQGYIDGCVAADSKFMKPSFSERATMFSVGVNGALEGGEIGILFTE